MLLLPLLLLLLLLFHFQRVVSDADEEEGS